ncbi:MAG: hypothetical protein M0R46_15370 [Candidatus Muirbacterium halophilum]|nr:hypothetical protein [Candidatus Muirbacterium halophilum]
MRIAGELSNIQLDEANLDVKVNMLKKSMEVQKDTSSQLMNSLVETCQGIRDSSPVGKNVDLYA